MKKPVKLIAICGLTAAVLIKAGCSGQSGPVQAEISTNKAYVTSADGTMAVITHGDIPQLLRTVTVGGSGDINAGLGHAYVNNSAGNSVTAIDGETDVVIGSIGVGTNPVHNLVINEEGIGLLIVGNDGPEGDTADDSISVIDINPNHATFLSEIARIRVGDGHHKLTYSHETNRVAVSNLSAGTVSIVDLNTLSVLCTVTAGLVPHGLDYSHESGHAYNANVADPVNAITIIDLDASFPIPADPYDAADPTCTGLVSSTIPVGTGAGQIPASGYTHANHDGTFVFTVGYDAATLTGYISSINAATDAVANVLALPNFQPDKLVVFRDEDNPLAPDRIYISSIEDEADPVTVPGITVAVLDSDVATGVMSLHPTPAFAPLPDGFLPVGRGHDHRALFVTHHGDRLYVPNSGADPGTVTVFGIDTTTDPDTFTVLDTFEVGEEPNALTMLDHVTLEIPEDPTGGGHEH